MVWWKLITNDICSFSSPAPFLIHSYLFQSTLSTKLNHSNDPSSVILVQHQATSAGLANVSTRNVYIHQEEYIPHVNPLPARISSIRPISSMVQAEEGLVEVGVGKNPIPSS